MTTTTRPPVVLNATRADSITELLNLCEQFLRCHASHSVHAELADFLTDQGLHPTTATTALIDGLEMTALQLRTESATDAAHDGTHGGETQ